eukprot:Platyproteum_vivax@DN1696_c0_g1_i1.p1
MENSEKGISSKPEYRRTSSIRKNRHATIADILPFLQIPVLLIALSTFTITYWYYTSMIDLTRNLQEANTFSSVHSEYSSEQTLKAMEILEDFVWEHPNTYPAEFVRLRESRNTTERDMGRQIDRARRHLVHWYSRVRHLNKLGYLTSKNLEEFPGSGRSLYFIKMVEPIEKCSRRWNGRQLNPVFDFLRELYALQVFTDLPCPDPPHPSASAALVQLPTKCSIIDIGSKNCNDNSVNVKLEL